MDPGPLFAAHPNVMLLVDPDSGRILAANEAAVRFYGWSAEELCARTILDLNLLPPEEVRREVRSAEEQQRTYFAFRHRTAGGEVRDVEVYSGPIVLDGTPVLVSTVHDATERHQAVARLRESESFSRAILASAPVGIAVADLDGRLVRVNHAMSELTGYPEVELIGMHRSVLTHPEDQARSDAADVRLLTGGAEQYRVEKRYRRRDGTTAHVDVSSTLVRAEDGTPLFQVGVILDRTAEHLARAEAVRAAERLQLTMASVTDAIFIVDRDWTVTFVNRRFGEALGVRAEEVVGRSLWESFPHDVGGGFHRAYEQALADRQPRTVVERAYDSQRWFEARAYPSDDALVVYLSDVTDRVRYQERLQEIAVVERANAQRLAELDSVKNAFLSAVSHELRTPLTVIRGMAETLVRLRDDLGAADRERIEAAVLDQSARLAELLDELLDVDRLARGTLTAERQDIDVAALVREVVAASSVAQRAELEVPGELVGTVDPVQISHLLANLLSNAGKYAPKGPVQVRLYPQGAQRLRLEVEDQGPGIASEDRERVFEPFRRLDDDHPQPGTGVGLALVAEFARLHGGRAWIADGSGTRVVVELATGADPDRLSATG
ncbi:MAG: PAS domain S-box protein [Nitriliruptoraceae bacterium]